MQCQNRRWLKYKKKKKTQLDIVLEISQHPPREYASEQVGLVRTH